MPDIGQWLILALLGLGVAALVAVPFRRPVAPERGTTDRESLALRHRLAVEALIDVEADRRAGSLDDAGYQRQLAEEEARAADTLAALDALAPPRLAPGAASGDRSRRVTVWLGGGLAVLVLIGFVLPEPLGLGERTSVNQPLADQIAAEEARLADIQRLLTSLAANQDDPATLSDLADAYLAGGAAEDLQRAAIALQVLISVDPLNASAYQRLITAYLSAGDLPDARAATDSYRTLVGDDAPDVPFFLGLIALRGGDATEAIEQFDRFLELAPDDDRAPMIRSLRAEAAGG
ncbi:MAG: tetratricopeptide repeat protein [Chloroflexota bacterium]|nr:tetratricopeptide repeat protein [Chloroflexota bacterium]